MTKTVFTYSALLLLLIACADRSIDTRNNQEQCRSIKECAWAVKDKIERSWIKPVNTKNLDASIRINLNSNGELISIEVEKSSGNEEFDKSVIDAAWSSSPFTILSGLDEEEFKTFQDIILIFSPDS